MRLCFDIGNTRRKCALYDRARLVEQGEASEPFLLTLFRHYPADITQAVASVVGPEPEWNTLIPTRLKLHKLSHTSPLPFSIVGEHPETIGADRLAACLGAWQRYPGQELVVVDAGTCITLDYLDAQGHYRAGVILPGLQMSLNAMHHYTALLPQLRFDASHSPHLQPADTADCLLSGVALQGRFALEGLLSQTPQARILFTGGDSQWLQAHVSTSQPTEYQPNLLFEGLNNLTL